MSTDTGTHHLGTHGWLRLLVAAALVLVLVLTLEASPAAGASSKVCRVRNIDSGRTFTTLQAAVDAARPGARLTVRGICRGTTVIDKNLVIVGERTESSGKPTLSGGQAQNKSGGSRPPPGSDLRDYEDRRGRHNRVVEIEQGARVKLRDLLITRGLAVRGGGIRNRGDLTLRDVLVRGNSNDPHNWWGDASGVYNEGRLRLNGATRIAGNHGTAGTRGEVLNRGTLVVNGTGFLDSLVNGRHAALTMNASSSLGGRWGGRLRNYGRVTMNDASWLRPPYNVPYDEYCDYGVSNFVGTFTMNDTSSIRDGHGDAAGVRNYGTYYGEPATFTMNDASSISGNPKGGLVNDGIVRMNDASSIHDNTRHCAGGGVTMLGGKLRMTASSSITANTVIDHDIDDDWQCDYGVRGGGLSHSKGTLVGVTCGPGGNVFGNTPDDCHFE